MKAIALIMAANCVALFAHGILTGWYSFAVFQAAAIFVFGCFYNEFEKETFNEND